MADFVQTMKDWRRMCAGTNCSECEITDYCEGIPCASIDKIQQIVTAWAAEHPEPVYPTWIDYLSTVGLIIKTDNCTTCAFDFTKAHVPIPVDIAEKLGIEPKEG